MLAARSLHLAFGGPPLLESVSFEVHAGERVCIVGRNGAGKSSLLKVLCNVIPPDRGEVYVPANERVAYLPQEVPEGIDGTVAEVIVMDLPDGLEDWEREARLDRLLRDLEFDGEEAFDSLSAGMKRRVLLGRCLAPEPDVLLLDEPTNHLDIESIGWMERFLPKYPGALLFVTHDRAFLKKIATRILDLERGVVTDWGYNYETYLQKKEEWLVAEAHNRAEFDKKLAKEEAWIRQGILARRTRNEGRVRALKSMRDQHRQRRERQGSVRLAVEEADRSGVKVIAAEGVSFGYNSNPIVRDFSTVITRGDKIGIVGPNGAGKSTLLNLLLGRLSPQEGTVKHGTGLEIAYFDQLRETLDPEQTVVDSIADGRDTFSLNGQSRHVIGYLQDFLFHPEQARGKVKALSGGERNRLLLARLFTRPFNLLIMDEPTNDLDLETLELLENRLVEFGGTLLLVSHDRAFIDNVVTDLFILEGKGEVRQFVGGYTDYLNRRAVPSSANTGKVTKTVAATKSGKPPKTRKFLNRERWELEALPAEIEALETEQAEITEKLGDPNLYQSQGDQVATFQARIHEIEASLATKYSRWEELEQLKETLEG
ncbi:ATP-binding cassette domain-containing protein [Rubellicoccus peritrichatus]|uniref:ATP-binding protein Uup n=1 Tax=Rubellicoccus peritrichatus TaxID=3080537 RepID=A0AAQ3LEF7_9BACT|nr:ATP-binding cassette domain-containing protein [Puniceicoccus sp. CR14]WOO42118.1 ATP-binding cassette domain-containing protein [Puniceicoccus sp. CR14]